MVVSPPISTILAANIYQAWSIGRSIAISRSLKQDPITDLLKEQNGILLFTGKIVSVTRKVSKGFTRGNITIARLSEEEASELYVEFENENLSAVLKEGSEEKTLAVCPDLIQVSYSTLISSK